MAKFKDRYDVIIVGTGVAGLNCALHLPADKSVLVICKKSPEESDSYLAQGGICRLRGDFDFEEYYEDTLRAGHNENDPAAVRSMISGSQQIIADLEGLGVSFAKNGDGTFNYTREGGHTSPRICYHEDCTGKEITSALMRAVQKLANVQLAYNVVMLDVIEDGARCYGIVAYDKRQKKVVKLAADYTVLATGGLGGAFKNSTNFSTVTGDSIVICLNHGVEVQNINYIQVHPTTLYSKKRGRRFLISESVRGEGAVLLDKNFNRFTDELQPRDVVKEAVYSQMQKDGTPFVWLDMRPIGRKQLEEHFPQIVSRCAEEGYDAFNECIPVVPAIHYFMGGVKSDLNGRTTLCALYAAGETCCNGVHGKNRLASNSLLESLLFAKAAAIDIESTYSKPDGKAARAALEAVDEGKYEDVARLTKKYKKQLIKAVALADAGKDVNAYFKGIKV